MRGQPALGASHGRLADVCFGADCEHVGDRRQTLASDE